MCRRCSISLIEWKRRRKKKKRDNSTGLSEKCISLWIIMERIHYFSYLIKWLKVRNKSQERLTLDILLWRAMRSNGRCCLSFRSTAIIRRFMRDNWSMDILFSMWNQPLFYEWERLFKVDLCFFLSSFRLSYSHSSLKRKDCSFKFVQLWLKIIKWNIEFLLITVGEQYWDG